MDAQVARAIAGNSGAVRAIRWLTLLGLAVAFGMFALGGVVLFDARQDAWRQVDQSSHNLVTALERDIRRTIELYDLSLQGAVETLLLPGLQTVSPELRHAALFDRSTTADYLGSLLLLDAQGTIVDDSTSVAPHTMNFADRDYFQVHRDRPDVGFYISETFRSRLRNGDASISISRRIAGADGAFAGVAVGTLRLAYFYDLFSKLNLGPNGAVSLVRTDGALVVRTPPVPAGVNLRTAASAVIGRFATDRAGAFVTKSNFDGTERFLVYQQVGSLPLIVVVANSLSDIYAPWWRKAIGIGSILLILCGALVILCLLFRREMLRRLQAELAVSRTADRLAIMASTDELTGLANRRAFERELEVEWRRAARAQASLAVLMIDADWFKPFNDRYGHAAGDAVLGRIAEVIQRMIRRPGDIGARYGGEEFVVLLPDTELEGGLSTARRICKAIAEMPIKHAGSPLGCVSVSVGVAIAFPGQDRTPRDVLRQADGALYEAKRTGRARVCVAAPGDAPAMFPAVGR